ncbi:MAG: PaaI family thioesterase [Acidimicrobiia bacterium]|nr:PaaI family thioesterase [Acidimicrobiia bacterium]
MGVPGPEFERFDERVAAGLASMNDRMTGLPAYLGLRITDVSAGRMRAEIEITEELHTPFGNLHGGVIAALVDHVLGTVLYPVVEPGAWAATTEFKLNYLAPVTRGTLAADAEIVSITRSTAVVRIEVANEGRAVALAQGTVLIKAPKARG